MSCNGVTNLHRFRLNAALTNPLPQLSTWDTNRKFPLSACPNHYIYEPRQGKGNVMRSMFRDIDAECYVMTDGDDTYPAEFAREMVEKVYLSKAQFNH